jgi:hypothetical protein
VQRHQSEGRHLQIARMPAMRVVVADEDRLFLAQLRPARSAMLADRVRIDRQTADRLAA